MDSIWRILKLLLLVVALSIPSTFVFRGEAKRSLPQEDKGTKTTSTTAATKKVYPSLESMKAKFPSLSDNFCQVNNPNDQFPQIRLSHEQFRFYHIGKAAGGTVNTRLKAGYGIHYEQCHPNPTPCFDEDVEISTKRQHRFVTIRDPIDRAVASFEWLLAMRCNPGETKEDGCKEGYKDYVESVYEKYDENPSLLGEALCDPKNGYRLNQDVVENDIVNLHHLKADNFIHRWLGEHRKEEFDWTKYPKYVYPLVVEKGYDLIRMVDDAVYLLAHSTLGKVPDDTGGQEVKDASKFSYAGDLDVLPLRHYHAQCRQEATEAAGQVHSAAARNRPKPFISEHAQLCFARYYQRDYELLPDLKKLACKSVDCHAALQSIIDRRAPLLAKLPPL